MDLQLEGRRALVTGGSKGIGLACARLLAREGARVALVARDPGTLQRAAAALADEGLAGVATAAADLRDAAAAADAVRAAEQALGGPIEILVNSAGAAQRTPPDELRAEHWHAALDAKFFTYVHAMQAVVHAMAARGAGVIVNVVGTGGKIAAPIHLPGGAANAALLLASAGLANAFAARGVRVVAVNPGLTATERMHEGFAAQARMSGASVEEVLARQTKAQPMGRIATPEEVARVVVFLASPAASYVSGAMVSVDGAATPMVL